ncbi:MAG: hypothetical protein Q3M30_18235 [Candidatus Electrothrix sp. Rat3]|nr:hypothetical protein [Candidatus Electrothrix rattekaaiensis]
MKFIELNRRFRNITEEELGSPELLFSFGERFLHSTTDDWTKLLESRRVVLLAEAGSGKTEEMREQASKLKEEGKYAFYVEIEKLIRKPLTNLLVGKDKNLFNRWRETSSPAYFFLDAVDELKLVNIGDFKESLGQFSNDIYELLDRVNVVISCRPSDWKFDLDLEAVQDTLPILSSAPDSTDMTGEKLFLAPFRRNEGNQQDKSADEEDEVRTVVMLPLTLGQIEFYARSSGVQDAEAFMEEIQRQEAWLFANRPLDCGNLVQIWNTKGKLGTRVEQHEANIAAKLKDDPERPDNNLLSDDKAREGAERLALALALTRTRTLLAPGHEAAEGVLDSVDILTDWTPAQRNALLRRGLFDPATYGRIRFHHRSVEEYLAACHFRLLRKKGMSIKSLKHFFFAERYGAEVVIPSMRPIAAWLALWNEDIRRELIRREPEVLLAYGDPGALSIEDRAELLRFFAAAYGKGGWRGISISIGEIRRLAHPELAPVLRELWGKYLASKEVCDLLLEIISQGAIENCVDIAENVVWDMQRSEHQRGLAVFGLVACNQSTTLRKIAESILTEQNQWPGRTVPQLAHQLFPRHLSVNELVALIKQTPEPRSVISEFSWYLEQIAGDIDPSFSTAVELRNAIADLIWQGRHRRQEGYGKISGKYGYLSSGLAILCEKQLSSITSDRDLIRACAVANRFEKELNAGEGPQLIAIKKHFKDNPALRERAFLIEVDLMSCLVPAQEDRLLDHDVMENSLLGPRSETSLKLDRGWLFKALNDTTATQQQRHVALEGLLLLWHLNERSDTEVEQLRQAVADDSFLAEKVKRDTAPIKPNPKKEKWERRRRRRECVRKGRERQRIEKWQKWREELLADIETAFSSEQVFSTLHNLYHWLNIHTKRHRPSKVWNKIELIQAFNEEVASRAANACKIIWHKESPTLWSYRTDGERDLMIWHYALCGLIEESSSPGWAKRLTDEEAKRAAAYATLNWDDFPSWFAGLVKEHPGAVESILGDELDRQLAMASDHQHLPLLYRLSNAEVSVKKLLAPRLCAALPNWPKKIAEEKSVRFSADHLGRVIKILDETAELQERQTLAAECSVRFSKEPDGPLALSWLAGLFRFDPEQAVEVLEQGLNAVKKSAQTDLAVRLFAGLFEGYSGRLSPSLLAIDDQAVRANALKCLLRCAYTYIHPEQDQVHDDGPYSPDTRDDAASARSSLLESLLNTTGSEAHKIILELADDPLFAHFPDRLRLLAREQAAKDAEFASYASGALVALEKKFEAPPRSRDELFEVMMDRLEDLQHEITHHKFTIRLTLRRIEKETEMQSYLAGKLNDKANESYTAVEREPEDADRKKPDIRLSAVLGNQQAAIEIKLVENWSINDFRRALRNQLVGQYLRHETCKAGCLLLTCNGSKKFWIHPETQKRICFPELIKLLQDEAEVIKQEKNHEIRLAVFGLDLTDPHLEPAHGSLRQIEDRMDIEDAEKALADPAGNIPAQEVWKELGL